MPYFPLQVSIPEPCSENWDAMTPVDQQRRHCAACDKTLTDFSHMTDRQIGQILRTNGGNLCGRFRKSQLDRPLRLAEPRRRRGIAAVAASAGLLLAAPAFGQGVTPEPMEQVERSPKKEAGTPPGKVVIKGTVTDESGEGLIGASILISGTTIGTITDLDGRFQLVVSDDKGVTLAISYTGFSNLYVDYTSAELQSQTFKQETEYVLEESVSGLMGVIIVGYVKKNTLLDNLMVHPVDPIYEAPDYSHRTKNGDWKDYWRDLFAKRKARRAERRAARRARKTAKEVAKQTIPEVLPLPAPEVMETNAEHASFNLQASPNPFDQELRVTYYLPQQQAVTLYLLDLSGRILHQEKRDLQKGKQELTLRQRLGSLTPGTYFLRLVGEKGQQQTIQLVR